MSRKVEKSMIVGLDIGTSKITAIVGEVNEENQLEIKSKTKFLMSASGRTRKSTK